VTDASGAKVEEIHYKPYGATDWDSNGEAGGTNYRYNGQQLDIETTLYFYHARYYDPILGRFLSADVVGVNHSVPQSLNKYSYVFNNPIQYVDPNGESAVDVDDGGSVVSFVPCGSPSGACVQVTSPGDGTQTIWNGGDATEQPWTMPDDLVNAPYERPWPPSGSGWPSAGSSQNAVELDIGTRISIEGPGIPGGVERVFGNQREFDNFKAAVSGDVICPRCVEVSGDVGGTIWRFNIAMISGDISGILPNPKIGVFGNMRIGFPPNVPTPSISYPVSPRYSLGTDGSGITFGIGWSVPLGFKSGPQLQFPLFNFWTGENYPNTYKQYLDALP